MQKSLAEIQEEEAREAAAEAERKKKAVAARAPVATPNAYSSAASSGGWERGAPNVAPRAKSMLEEIQEQEEREAAAALQAARAGGGGVPAPQSRWAAKVGAGMGGGIAAGQPAVNAYAHAPAPPRAIVAAAQGGGARGGLADDDDDFWGAATAAAIANRFLPCTASGMWRIVARRVRGTLPLPPSGALRHATDRDNVCEKNSLKDVAPQQTSATQATPSSATDEDNFWDFKDSDSKKNDDKKKKEAPKGASKTLNKSQQDQFSKWCFGELAKLTGSDDTTLGEFATVFAGARGLARPCACTCAVE